MGSTAVAVGLMPVAMRGKSSPVWSRKPGFSGMTCASLGESKFHINQLFQGFPNE
jgi:hypothetical protein